MEIFQRPDINLLLCSTSPLLRQDLKSRRNPRLVPYALLDERTKKSNRDSLREAIRTLVGYGYDIDPPDQEGETLLYRGFIYICLCV